MSLPHVVPELPVLPNPSGDVDTSASILCGLAPTMTTPQPIQELLFRLQSDLVVAHRVANRLREERDRAWAESRQLRADVAHSEQQWRHDFMEVQNELNKEKRSRIELEKILEETISSASHFEADLTACKIRERVMQRQLARYSSASRTPASSGATAMRRHGRRARYDLDSSGFGLRPPANGAYTDEQAMTFVKGSSRMQSSHFDSSRVNDTTDPSSSPVPENTAPPDRDRDGEYSQNEQSPCNAAPNETARDDADPDGSREGAKETVLHPSLPTEADMIGVLEQLEYMNQRLASLHSDNLGLRKLLDTVKNERDHLYEKLSLSVPSLDTISKDMSSLDHDNNDFAAQYMLEIDELKVELAKKSEDIRSLTAQLQSIEAGRGKRLATDSSKDHLIDGEFPGSSRCRVDLHDAASRSHATEVDGGTCSYAASDGARESIELGDMRSRLAALQTELEENRDALRREKLYAQNKVAKMQEEIAWLKSQLQNVQFKSVMNATRSNELFTSDDGMREGPAEETDVLRLQLLVQQLRCEVDGAETRGRERLRRAQAAARQQAETIDILTRALQQHRSIIHES